MAMTKAQARKRLIEARKKFQAFYMASWSGRAGFDYPMSVRDMEAIDKIVNKYLNKMK